MASISRSTLAAQPPQSKSYTINSKVLNETRRIRVALPANYSFAKRKYPVIYLLDGHVREFFDLTVASAGFGTLGDVRDFAIPAQIVVAIEHKERGADMGRNGDLFMRYLTEEVAPFVEKQFRALPYRVLVGHSLGGRYALMASCRAPGFFPAVVAISPGGGDSTAYKTTTDCLRSDWRTSKGIVRQVFISSGEREQRIDEGAKRLRNFVRDSSPPNVRWRYLDGPDLGHTETPFFGIPAGIKFVWDRALWEMPVARADSVLEARGDPDTILRTWYSDLGARVGFAVPTSEKWLDAAVVAHLSRGNVDAAERTARRLTAEYPEYLSGYGRLTDVLVRKRDFSTAKKVLEDAVKMIDKLDFFDETERAMKRKILTDGLTRFGPGDTQ